MADKMQLTRIIPEHVETVVLKGITTMKRGASVEFLAALKRHGKPTHCWWCKAEFQPGHEVAMVACEDDTNVLLCDECAKKARDTRTGRGPRRKQI